MSEAALLENFIFCADIFETKEFCIAGGAIVSIASKQPVKDIDCFFINEDNYNVAIENIHYKAKLIKSRNNSKMFKLKSGLLIDLILPGKDSFDSIVNKFDLVHTQQYFTQETGLVSHGRSAEYTESKQLHLNVITYPWLTFGRIARKLSQGWIIDPIQERNIIDYCYNAPWGPGVESEYLL